MALTANTTRGRIVGIPPWGHLPAFKKGFSRHRTTRSEQFLLMVTIALLPLQDYFPAIGGFSILFILFIISGTYILFSRPGTLVRMSFDRLFITAYILLVLGSLIEPLHPYASYSEISRIGQMIAGAI